MLMMLINACGGGVALLNFSAQGLGFVVFHLILKIQWPILEEVIPIFSDIHATTKIGNQLN